MISALMTDQMGVEENAIAHLNPMLKYNVFDFQVNMMESHITVSANPLDEVRSHNNACYLPYH